MDYYTLNVVNGKVSEQHAERLSELSGYDFYREEEGFCAEANRFDYKSYYELSKAYPDTLFALERSGENFPDFVKTYAKNGAIFVVRGEIVYPELDESKMEIPSSETIW